MGFDTVLSEESENTCPSQAENKQTVSRLLIDRLCILTVVIKKTIQSYNFAKSMSTLIGQSNCRVQTSSCILKWQTWINI